MIYIKIKDRKRICINKYYELTGRINLQSNEKEEGNNDL